MMTVTSGVQSAPASIFAVSQCGSGSDGFHTLGCLTSGFSPADSLKVKWADPKGTEISDSIQYPAILTNGAYMSLSYVRVKASEWNSEQPFKCTAEHPAGSKTETLKKEVQHVHKPNVYLLSKEDGNQVQLFCTVEDFYPDKLTVQWFEGESVTLQKTPNVKKFKSDKSKNMTYTQISRIDIEAKEWNKGTEYGCKATHNSVETITSLSKCKVNPSVKPQIHLAKPHLKSILTDEQITASCTIESVYDAKISWILDEDIKKPPPITQQQTQSQPRSTYVLVSHLTVTVREWQSFKTVTCKAEHPCFSNEQKTISVVEPLQGNPSVLIRRRFADRAVLECVSNDLPSGELAVTFQSTTAEISRQYVDLPKDMHTVTTHVTTEEYKTQDDSVSCTVHQTHNKKWTSNSIKLFFGDPSVELSVVPIFGQSVSDQQKLQCIGTGFNPKIKWFVNSVEKHNAASESMMQADGQGRVFSEISVSQQDWNHGTIYKCEIHDEDFKKSVQKSTSVCAVNPSVKPQIHLAKPNLKSILTDEQITASCTIESVYDAKISWILDEDIKKPPPITQQQTQSQPRSTYVLVSHLTVTVREWQSFKTVTCKAEHPCFSNEQKTISVVEPLQGNPSVLIRRHFADRAVLECVGNDLPSGELAVTFQSTTAEISRQYVDLAKDVHTVTRHLTTPEEYKTQDDSVSCTVHQTHNTKWTSNSIKLFFDPKRPTVQILQPSDRYLSGPHDKTLLCLISGFYPAEISVYWELNGERLDESRFSNSPIGGCTVGTDFNMHSVLTLAEPGHEDNSYSCIVSHQSSETPIVSSIPTSVVKSRPAVDLLWHSDELVCLASNYSPSAINITWLQDGEAVQPNTTTHLAKDTAGKFMVQSRLQVGATDWKAGTTYICQVEHTTGTVTQRISKEETLQETIFFDENLSQPISQDSVEDTWNTTFTFIALFVISLIYGCLVTLVKLK
ncbi:uncharacterized protein LOC143483817 isoform X2 [Brachyhypopomus gauderio]|uniref:uncharacterized protein LOC143483817 isoform X2 n=2 Tax=Brachyhypopomus gauderio TaxID=698409 RepID=UPI004042457F